MKLFYILSILLYVYGYSATASKSQSFVEVVIDSKDWKKLLRTRTNILALYSKGRIKQELNQVFVEVSKQLKGSATLVHIDCSGDGKKLCKKNKVEPSPYVLKHYKEGSFHKDYDRRETVQSMVTFLRDPGGDVPWDEDDTGIDVVHVGDLNTEPSLLVMFYAPWCGHCKKMKPEYMAAATIIKERGISGRLAAVDVTKETKIALEFGIKGYPTLKYFQDGKFSFDLKSLREKDKIIEFLASPEQPPLPPPPDKPWSEEESAVIHLTDDTFKPFLKKKKHVLVMFYAPWCGHCKKAKPEFTTAASKFADDSKIEFAAIDCTRYQSICSLYDVNGYPTFLYFSYYKNSKLYNGGRTTEDFIAFMHDPDKPSLSQPKDSKEAWAQYPGAKYLYHLMEKDFDEFVQEKEVLVMFYAPWCGHCTAMKGDFAAAAAELAEANHSGVLATVDATTENKLANKFGVKGFPTLKFLRNGQEVTEYNGNRKQADIVTFMLSPPKDEL